MVKVLRATPERRWSKRALLLVLSLVTVFGSLAVSADAYDQAKRINDRIAGVPADFATLQAMRNLIAPPNNDPLTAALMATDNPSFYNVTLKNFVAPWTNRDHNVFVPLNDYTATVIGMIREDVDFRSVLFGDILYVGVGSGIPNYSPSDNANYDALEAKAVNLADSSKLVRVTQSSVTGVPSAATAGVLTTRAASKAFFIAGTNRAMFRFTLVNHLCRDMEQVHDTSRAPDRIRQDVSRSPGGDARVFLNGCIGCHTGMDPMTQFDAAALPLYDSFTIAADTTPFKHLPAQVDLNAVNQPDAYGTKLSATFDFSREDAADDLLLNEVVWRSVRGKDSAMPAPVRAGFVFVNLDEDEEEEEEEEE